MNLLNKKPYLLYVGNAFPHKNLERLVLAFGKLKKEKTNLNLILVGKIDYFYKRIKKLVKELDLKDVYFPGKVSDKELKSLYKNALLYIFPSLEEGFGLPGLEAMKNKLPVICSNKASLPEIYKDAALYFNPKNVSDIYKKILNIINNKQKQKDLVKKGKKQVKKYSWEKCAKQTLKVYNSLE